MKATLITPRMYLRAYSPPYEGGVAAPVRKMVRSHRNGADGVVARKPCCGVSDHPVRSFQRWLRSIFLMSRPPLLRRGCCKTEGTLWTRVGQRISKMAGMSYEKQANYDVQWLFPPSLED